ncbi:MAG: flavodoxin domain-containing protein [Candidatus Helarchaeota archaeon]
MSKKKVLIVFGTRYGGTALIIQKIVKLLEQAGIESNVVDLRSIKKKNWPSIGEHDAVLVGSGISMGRWVGAPKKFLKKNRDLLNKEDVIFGIFVSSGTAIDKYEEAREKYLVKFAEKNELKPDIFDTFGAIYDLSETTRAGGFARKVLQNQAIENCEKRGIEFKSNGINEFIDESRLKTFVDEFVALLTK